mgnify:CR=1 FL=1
MILDPQLRRAKPDDAVACVRLRGRTRENAVSESRLLEYGITAESWANDIAAGTLPGWIAELDGETVRRADVHCGYLHRGFEKEAEHHTYHNIIPYTDRLNYCSALINDFAAQAMAITLLHADDVTMIGGASYADSQFNRAANQFNQYVQQAWDKVIDFIKLHYCLSDRNDSAFWRDNRSDTSIPATLQQKLQQWQHQVPSAYDFPGRFDIFHADNYFYVLFGMGFNTDISAMRPRLMQQQRVAQLQTEQQQYLQQARQALLPHRQLIERIKQHGLSSI